MFRSMLSVTALEDRLTPSGTTADPHQPPPPPPPSTTPPVIRPGEMPASEPPKNESL
jgi:hypothetical protein